ncbi:LysE family translocator [Serratia ureilytica]|uniref:LysE family translocator n=1 Tax=Serratia ureilytica TaxID=300181 RepID=UPI0018D62052|nr:LysE family translocator [Serratia ureilytica]MBH3121737.1 LysE family translocator [Serratia ureilytica]
MPSAETFIAFLVALTLLELSPGPDMMLTLARGIGQGRRIALLNVFGMVFVAGMVQVSMLVLGLATLLHAYPLALDVLRWVGAAYLVWLGIKMLKVSRQRSDAVRKPRMMTEWQAVKEGAINSLTNPKSLLFMFAFLPQFVNPETGPVWLQLLVLGSIQKLAGILSLGSVAMASGTVGQWLARNPRLLVWQQRFTGLVMMGLGAKLLLGGGATSAPR